MTLVSILLVAFVAFQHVAFFVLETLLVKGPIGAKVFKLKPSEQAIVAPVLANQGVYNGFLAVGLVWGLVEPVPVFAFALKIFFLGCVFVAGIFGGLTTVRSILFIQALPAALALFAVWRAGHGVG